MEYTYFISKDTNPYINQAIEQYFVETVNIDEIIIYLWQNHNTIVIGRNQDAYRECRVEEFIDCGGHIARRRSGGGAVYHDSGNLNVSVIYNSETPSVISLYKLLKRTLTLCGIGYTYNTRNDILVDGRKIIGCAEYRNISSVCMHGSILVDTDIDRMQYFLTPNANKLAKHSVDSVSARVINLREVADIDITQIQNAIIKVTNAFEMSDICYSRINEIVSIYKSSDWIIRGIME